MCNNYFQQKHHSLYPVLTSLFNKFISLKIPLSFQVKTFHLNTACKMLSTKYIEVFRMLPSPGTFSKLPTRDLDRLPTSNQLRITGNILRTNGKLSLERSCFWNNERFFLEQPLNELMFRFLFRIYFIVSWSLIRVKHFY